MFVPYREILFPRGSPASTHLSYQRCTSVSLPCASISRCLSASSTDPYTPETFHIPCSRNYAPQVPLTSLALGPVHPKLPHIPCPRTCAPQVPLTTLAPGPVNRIQPSHPLLLDLYTSHSLLWDLYSQEANPFTLEYFHQKGNPYTLEYFHQKRNPFLSWNIPSRRKPLFILENFHLEEKPLCPGIFPSF